MTSFKPVDTPISTFKVTVILDCLFSDPKRFCQIIGALQYLIFMRPNICLLLTKSISLWILLQILIGLSLNTLCVIFGVWFLMAYISLIVTPLLYMILRMQTGLVVLMIASLWVVTLSFLVIY